MSTSFPQNFQKDDLKKCSDSEQNQIQYITTENEIQNKENLLESVKNLINILEHNISESKDQEKIDQQEFNEDKNSSNNNSQKSKSQKKTSRQKIKEVSISEPREQAFNAGSQSKQKSKFVKNTAFDSKQPHIITSSYRSFLPPSKTTVNINQSNNFLCPGDNLNRELTSAGNIILREEIECVADHKTNRSALGQKSNSSQVAKQTTFAALPSKRSHEQSNIGISLYEQVLAKNFEVIDSLLRKLDQIYSNQDEYESSLTQISQRLHKIETDNENIHHEFRTSHFMIDKKLNSITNEYSNMLHEINMMKKMWKQVAGGFGKSSLYIGLQGNSDYDEDCNYNSRRMLTRRNSKRASGRAGFSSRKSGFSTEKNCDDQSENLSRSHRKHKKDSNWTNLKGIDERNLGKILLEKINESSSWEDTDSNSDSNKDGIQYDKDFFNSKRYQSRDKNRNSRSGKNQSKNSLNGKRVSIDNFERKEFKVIKDFVPQQIIKLSQKTQEMNKFTLLGIETMMTKKCEALQEKFLSFGKQIIEQGLSNELKKSIFDEIEQKTLKTVQNNIQLFNAKMEQNMGNFQGKLNKKMSLKSDKQEVRRELEEIVDMINQKVHRVMEECYLTFAQRKETRRAILFLQKKMNHLIQNAKKFNKISIPGETNDNVKCLSCDKNIPSNSGHQQLFPQPMFTQVHCKPRHEKSETEHENQLNETNRKSQVSSKAKRRKVKFTDITNLNKVSVENKNEKFLQQSTDQVLEASHDTPIKLKPLGEAASSSKQTFMKKIKNSQTVESFHFGSINSHLKSKITLNTFDTRPTGSINSSVHEAKNWKQKATNLLKKDSSGVDWRSKSLYKKAA